MGRWCWLVAGAALSCGSPQREFGSTNNGGASGHSSSAGAGGRAVAGEQNGGAPGGDAGDAGDANEAGAGGEAGAGERPACAGCAVDQRCVANGQLNPGNPCEICDTDRASDAYSPNQGARCGAAASTCSQPDTCDASGACAANDLDDGTPCSGGACEAGTCRIQPNPFDCIAPSPPPADFTAPSFSLSGTPPSAKGGTIADGRYAPVRFDLYNSEASGIDIRTFEFKKGYVQAETQYYAIETKGSFIPEVRFAGSFAISGSSLTFDLERCDPQYDIDIPSLSYTATSNGLVMIATLSDGGALVTSYLRQ